jgi:hypothetical protein
VQFVGCCGLGILDLRRRQARGQQRKEAPRDLFRVYAGIAVQAVMDPL